MNKRQVRKDISNKKIIELHNLGNSQTWIADQLHCSQNLIHYRLKKMGLAKPSQARVRKKKPSVSNLKVCSCCGKRPVPKKPIAGVQLTRLCYQCFRCAESDHENRDYPAAVAI